MRFVQLDESTVVAAHHVQVITHGTNRVCVHGSRYPLWTSGPLTDDEITAEFKRVCALVRCAEMPVD